MLLLYTPPDDDFVSLIEKSTESNFGWLFDVLENSVVVKVVMAGFCKWYIISICVCI